MTTPRHLAALPATALMAALFTMSACGNDAPPAAGAPESAAAAQPAAARPAAEPDRLAEILAAQPAEVQDRYQYRHPRETLEFFGIQPGMTVVEVLPGSGWYTKILLPWLGADGRLIGADYAVDMWEAFGFFDAAAIEAKRDWPASWSAEASTWGGPDAAAVSAFQFGALKEDMAGSADAVLFIRALHNLNRFDERGGYLQAALADAYKVLKPGGIVGIVQHHARDHMPDQWADGSNGYLKWRHVVDAMTAAGFEFVADSEINANQRDRPGAADKVWRLPPRLRVGDDDEARMRHMAIGESHRMTLKFRKPG